MGFEMGIILQGRAARWQGNFRQTLTRGQIWLCNAWEPHGFSVLTAPCQVLVIVMWSGGLAMAGMVDGVDYMSVFRRPASSRPQTRSVREKERLLGWAREILPAKAQDVPCREKQLLLVRLVLLELLRQTESAGVCVARAGGANSTAERIMPALNLVHDNPYRRIGLSEAARACRMSPALLVRLFRTMMGTSFAEYARRRRLAALAAEFRESETKLDALARKYGFIDAAHASKTFKACFGVTPGQFRESHRAT